MHKSNFLFLFILCTISGCVYFGITKTVPKLVFRAATEDEAFEYILYQSKMLPYAKKYGYNITLPQHEAFKKFYANPNAIIDTNALKKIFITELYNKSILEQSLKNVAQIEWPIKKALQKLEQLKKNWGFEVKATYEIVFTSYGFDVVHQYSAEVGKITILANLNTILQPGWLETTIIHKIVNIGIEENIIKKYNLGQWQKERIIDLICMLYLKDIIPYYRPNNLNKKNSDRKIDMFVNEQTIIRDLPLAIKKFKEY